MKPWLGELAVFEIGTIQGNGESIEVRAAGDLAENQIRAGKIGDHQSRPALPAGSIGPRKRYDNNFAGYRFDHAASSSGEFQSQRENRFAQLRAVERLIARVSFQADRKIVNLLLHLFRPRTDLLVDQFTCAHCEIISCHRHLVNSRGRGRHGCRRVQGKQRRAFPNNPYTSRCLKRLGSVSNDIGECFKIFSFKRLDLHRIHFSIDF